MSSQLPTYEIPRELVDRWVAVTKRVAQLQAELSAATAVANDCARRLREAINAQHEGKSQLTSTPWPAGEPLGTPPPWPTRNEGTDS
jgi:hypothetical protein